MRITASGNSFMFNRLENVDLVICAAPKLRKHQTVMWEGQRLNPLTAKTWAILSSPYYLRLLICTDEFCDSGHRPEVDKWQVSIWPGTVWTDDRTSPSIERRLFHLLFRERMTSPTSDREWLHLPMRENNFTHHWERITSPTIERE